MAFLNHLASLVVNIIVNTKQFNTQMNQVHSGLNGVIKNAARFYLVRAAFLTVANSIEAVIKHAAELEQGFINIERVAQHLKNSGFREEVAKLAADLPGIKLVDLQKALKVTAQLGIQGREELIEFAKQVTLLSTVTGISAEEIASDLGKIATVFKINPKEISKFINSVLQLSDDMTVTEQEILNITERLGGFANTIGLSATETAAFAAAMKSVGQATEVSRTALFSLFSRLVSHPGRVAAAFNLTKQQAQDLFVILRQDPAGGILKFLQLLQGKPAGEIIQALEKMKIAGARNAGALTALVNNLDKLKFALQQAAKGAEEDSRLLEQMNANAEGLTAKLNDLSDAWERFLATLGENQVIKDIIDELTSLLELINEFLKTTNKVPSIDFRNPDQVRARLNELKKQQQEWEASAGALSQTNIPGKSTFGNNFRSFIKDLIGQDAFMILRSLYNDGKINSLDKLIKGGMDEKARLREITRLQDLLRKLENKETKKEDKEKKDKPTVAEATREFNKLFNADLKESKKSEERDKQFRGFMGLEEAWKNMILDEQASNEAQFKKLDDIFRENQDQNEHLANIYDALKNRSPVATVV